MQTSSIRNAAIILFLVCGISIVVWATCADSLISAYGEIMGELSTNLKMTMEICPNPRRLMPVVPLTEHHFKIQANFDNFLVEVKHGEHCGRDPESVALVLLRDSKEVTRIKLDIKKDFVRDEKTWNYSLREGVKIEIPKP